jgi:hypothetical protein
MLLHDSCSYAHVLILPDIRTSIKPRLYHSFDRKRDSGKINAYGLKRHPETGKNNFYA